MKLKFTSAGTTAETDDGQHLTGEAARAAFDQELDKQQELRQRFAREHPREWVRYCQAKGYADAPPRQRAAGPRPTRGPERTQTRFASWWPRPLLEQRRPRRLRPRAPYL